MNKKQKKVTYPRDNFAVMAGRKPGKHRPRQDKRAKDKLRQELQG